jgi:hypothetical protein
LANPQGSSNLFFVHNVGAAHKNSRAIQYGFEALTVR